MDLTTNQTAERLNLSVRRVRVLCEAGRLKARKVGRDWIVDSRSVDRFSPLPPGRPAGKLTWSQVKTAAAEAAGTAWIVDTETDSRYITFTDPATLRSLQAYHVDGRTVVAGSTVSLREAAKRLAAELQTASRFGGLGDLSRLVRLSR